MPLSAQAPQIEKDKVAVREDALLQILSTYTPDQIYTYILGQFTFAEMSDTQIDTYTGNLASIADVKDAINIIAKELREIERKLATNIKVSAFLAKLELDL